MDDQRFFVVNFNCRYNGYCIPLSRTGMTLSGNIHEAAFTLLERLRKAVSVRSACSKEIHFPKISFSITDIRVQELDADTYKFITKLKK